MNPELIGTVDKASKEVLDKERAYAQQLKDQSS
jgi:hypothetical protein